MEELIKNFEELCGKKAVSTKIFKALSTFVAVNDARYEAQELGYSAGSMCMTQPIALMKGDVYIAKWKNIRRDERKFCEGGILSNDFREGDVVMVLF